MKRLTKRLEDGQAVMDCILCSEQGFDCTWLSCRNRLKNRVCDYEDTIQSNDLIKQKHGRWIDKTEVIVKPTYPPLENARVDCSACGHIFWHTSALTYNYCPNCGAKMDGDGNA